MPRQKSILKLRGTMDDITFYRTQDGHLARKAGGINKERILNSPSFQRTRENMNEFKSISSSARILRTALADMVKKVKDPVLGRRLFRTLSQVKNLDATSPRGQRRVSVGLATPEGQALLTGFDFNAKAALAAVLQALFTADPATGAVTIADFDSGKQLAYPSGATHVSFTAALSVVDLTGGTYSTVQSDAVNVAIGSAPAAVTAQPATVPAGTGFMLSLLLIEFFQEVNGVQYPLKNGGFNVLSLLSIAPVV